MIYRYTEVSSSVSGSPVKSLFVPFVNKGHLDIKVSGDFDLQGQIEAESCLCDINYLIERFNLGDVDALNKRQAFFADITAYPGSYREAVDILKEGRSFYDSLSADEKKRYGDFEGFMMSDFVSRFANPDVNNNPDGGDGDEPKQE
mgnify:CR=1 FL=1